MAITLAATVRASVLVLGAGHGSGGDLLADRKSFWAWCLESEEPTDADRAALAAKLSARYGTEIRARPVPSLDDAELRAPCIPVPDSVAGWCSTTTYDRARYAYGAHFTERVRAFNLDFGNPPTWWPTPATRPGGGHPHWCDANGYVTVPYGAVLGGVGGHPPRRPGPHRGDLADRLDRVLEIDDVSRAAALPACLRPHLRAVEHASSAKRPHPAALPAVVPVLHSRRLDRHPLRRPLRHQPHPHRRLRRVGAHDHPGRLVGVAALARLGCGAEPRPYGDRLRRPLRDHHRSLDAHPAPANLPGHRRSHLRIVAGRMRGRAPPGAGQAVAGQPAHPRPCRGPPGRRARRRGGAGDRVVRVC